MDEVAVNVVEVIADHPVFAECSTREVDELARLGTVLEVEPGYVLAREGRRGYEFFLVLSGTATCTSGATEATIGPGDVFGELGLPENPCRGATVTATSPMRLVAVDVRELNAALALDLTSDRTIITALTRRLPDTQLDGD